MYINGIAIKSTDKVKLLGVTIDRLLNFNEHIKHICNAANNKTNALLRIRRFIDIPKARALCYAYILSHFNYCPVIWMFCSKASNALVNRTHKRALRVVHENKKLSLEELLVVDSNVSIHVKNLRVLMVHIFKSIMHINPEFMWNIFPEKSIPYEFRNTCILSLPKTNRITYGVNGVLFRGSQVWNSLPPQIKSSISIDKFKVNIKTWNGMGVYVDYVNFKESRLAVYSLLF